MLGDQIRNIRIKRGMSQQELADKLNVTRQAISSWEVNRTEPSMADIRKIAKLLQCSVADLTDGNANVPPISVSNSATKATPMDIALNALMSKIYSIPEERRAIAVTNLVRILDCNEQMLEDYEQKRNNIF